MSDTEPALDAFRSDYILRFIVRVTTKNPFLLSLVVAAAGLGVTLLLAFACDTAYPKEAGGSALLTDYENLINFGIVMPVGVILVLLFYGAVNSGLRELVRNRVLFTRDAAATEGEQAEAYLKQIDARVNAPGFFWFALLASVGLNAAILIQKGEAWNGIYGGLPSYWFRLVAVGSFYVIFHVLLKGIAVVSVIRRLFATEQPAVPAGARRGLLDRGMARTFALLGKGAGWLLRRLGFLRGTLTSPWDITVQPLHPDGCGGLAPLGRIAMAMNRFLILIAVYCVVLLVAHADKQVHWQVVPLAIAFGVAAVYLFLAPLAPAHDKMLQGRERVLLDLNAQFEATSRRARRSFRADEEVPIEDLRKVELLDRLYRIASATPVWPFDAKIIARLIFGVLIPIISGLAITVLVDWIKALTGI